MVTNIEKNLLKIGGVEDQNSDGMITLTRTKSVLGTVTSDIEPQCWSGPARAEWN
jgi:hypothetical protein